MVHFGIVLFHHMGFSVFADSFEILSCSGSDVPGTVMFLTDGEISAFVPYCDVVAIYKVINDQYEVVFQIDVDEISTL